MKTNRDEISDSSNRIEGVESVTSRSINNLVNSSVDENINLGVSDSDDSIE